MKSREARKQTDRFVAGPFVTEDPEAAFHHFRPIVEALPAAEVLRPRTNIQLAHHNVLRGVDAFRTHRARLLERHPLCPAVEIDELPALALGMIYADERIAPEVGDPEIRAHLIALRPARALMLDQLDIFARLGLVPASRVREIQRGTGPLDAARDGIAIVGLFNEHAATVRGKHPFNARDLDELAVHAAWLVSRLRPTGAPSEPSSPSPEQILRDRFYTEVSRRYAQLRLAGIAAFGESAVGRHIPRLGARARAPGTSPSPGPTPVP